MNCTLCGIPLTTGLDTFGDVGAELCAVCFWGVSSEAKEAETVRRKTEHKEIRHELNILQDRISELRGDIEELQSDLAEAEEEYESLEEQLEGALEVSVHPTIVRRKVERWFNTVLGVSS